MTDGLADYDEEYTYDEDTGNLENKANSTLTYNAQVICSAGNRTIPHAASGMSGNSYTYDCNGNQITRVINGQTYNLSYDAENRLVSVTGTNLNATFTYDGDGKRVKSVINGVTTSFIGNHYEVTGANITKYYYAGSLRLAMRENATLTYIISDHLGSTSLIADASGTVISESKYKAWGEERYSSGTNPTDYTFTGQFSYTDDFGLVFYNARWYDPSLGRFAQADTIVPNGVQGLDRYAYVNNSPVNYIDPTGHDAWWCNTTSCQSNYNNSMANTGGGSFNISNNGGSGGGVVGGGGIGNSSNNCGFCDLVNSANDIMQELFGGHQYTAPPSLVCLPLPWINCTPSETDTYLAGNQFPGQLPWQPVQSLGQYNVFPAQFNNIDIMDRVSSGSGSIQVLIKDNTITNITNDTHIFHVGYVNRTSHEGPFGMTYVTTYGAGYNDGFEVWGHSIPGWMIDQANNLVGPFAFTALNVQMVLYTTWVETEQALNGIQQP